MTESAKLFIPLGELVDLKKELERLEKERVNLETEIKRVEGKLANESFVKKAPADLVEKERQKGDKYRRMLSEVIAGIEKIKD